MAAAQPQAPPRIAVLNVPGGGSELALDALATIDQLQILEQDWFIEQIQNRGFAPKGIMRRPDDLKWVMDGSDLDYVLFLAPVSERHYEARLVDDTGSVASQWRVDRGPDGLSSSGADLVRREVADYLDAQRPPAAALDTQAATGVSGANLGPAGDEDELDPNELKARAANERSATDAALSRDWLSISAGARFSKRDFGVVDANEETLLYKSAFYPGAQLNLEAFPFGMVQEDFQAVGFYLDASLGSDGVTIPVGDQAQEVGISHTEIGFGLALRTHNPARDMDSAPDPRTRFTLGFQLVNFNADPNPELPSISHVDITLGARSTTPVLTDGLTASFHAEIIPIGFMQTGADIFGETSTSHGVSGGIGVDYAFTESVGASAGYDGRIYRTSFEGQGTENFINANAFELVHGFSASLQYRY